LTGKAPSVASRASAAKASVAWASVTILTLPLEVFAVEGSSTVGPALALRVEDGVSEGVSNPLALATVARLEPTVEATCDLGDAPAVEEALNGGVAVTGASTAAALSEVSSVTAMAEGLWLPLLTVKGGLTSVGVLLAETLPDLAVDLAVLVRPSAATTPAVDRALDTAATSVLACYGSTTVVALVWGTLTSRVGAVA